MVATRHIRSSDEAAQKAEKAGIVLTRVGFAMRGVVYALIGIITLSMVFNIGKQGGTASQKGAIQMLAGEPWGFVLLILIIVGFVFYGLWLLSAAVRGDPRESGWKGVLYRIKNGFKAIIHFVLAAYACNLLSNRGSGGGGSSKQQEWTAKLLQHTWGRIVLFVIGVIVVGVAISQLLKAWKASFMEGMGIEALRGRKRKVILIAGRVGYCARGFILGLIGIGVMVAAWKNDASEAEGVDGTLKDIAAYPFGKVLLIAMAVGFWCFAVFQIACATWAKIE